MNDVTEVASESAADSGLHHHRPVVAHVDQVPPRRWHIAKLLEDRPIIERLSRTGCLRGNRRRNQDDGRIIGMTPPLALQQVIDRLHPLSALTPHEDVEAAMEDLVGRRRGSKDVVAIARGIWAAKHPRRR